MQEYTPEPTPTKHCPKCQATKPVDNFYRDVYKPDGRDNICKRCKATRRGTKFREPSPPTIDGQKWCRRCNQIKPLREFHVKSKSNGGRSATCKKCRSEIDGFRYRPSPRPGYKFCSSCKTELPASVEYFRLSTHEKSGFISRCRSCAAAGDKLWTQNNRERQNKNGRAWAKRNPMFRKAAAQRRAARERNLPGDFTESDWQHALDYFHGSCVVCGRPTGLFHTLAADHWIPLSSPQCPGTIPSNILPLCQGVNGCNNQKSGKPGPEWLASKFGKRKGAAILARIEAYFASLPSHIVSP